MDGIFLKEIATQSLSRLHTGRHSNVMQEGRKEDGVREEEGLRRRLLEEGDEVKEGGTEK